MMHNTPTWGPLLGRILFSTIFIMSGISKIFGFAGMVGFVSSLGLPAATLLVILAIAVEVGGGVAILVGYQTYWAAKILAAFLLVIALTLHRDFADQDQMVHFMKNLSMAGGALFIAIHGAGAYSLDNKMKKPTAL